MFLILLVPPYNNQIPLELILSKIQKIHDTCVQKYRISRKNAQDNSSQAVRLNPYL